MDMSSIETAEQDVEQQQQAEPEAGPSSKPYIPTTAPISSSSSSKKGSIRLPLHIPPSERILTLTEETKDSPPRQVSLQYNVCIPCREAISRCDGHEYFTRACIQCRKRGTKCTWVLSRNSQNVTKSVAGKRDGLTPALSTSAGSEIGEDNASTSTSDDENEECDTGAGRTASSATVAQQSETEASNHSKNLRFRFPLSEVEKKGHLKKRPVPSAGWDTVGKPAKKKSNADIKGKGKGKARALSQEEGNEEENEGGDDIIRPQDHSYLDENGETQEYQAILSQLNNTTRGLEYIEINNYTALLRSIFSEESNNLANSLYWWEFSESAKKIRMKWLIDLQLINKKEWRKMNYLDMLIAENTYNWVLWPRPPHKRDMMSDNMGTIYPPASLDDSRFISTLPEAIISTSLSLLAKSTLPDEIIQSMTPMHIKFWTQHKRDFGFSATIKSKSQWKYSTLFGNRGSKKSKFSIPPSSEDDFKKKYLDRDELILNIIEESGPPTAAFVLKAVDSVLLKIASLREKKGMRKPPSEKRNKSGKSDKSKKDKSESRVADDNLTSLPSRIDKGKGRVNDQDAQDSASEQEQMDRRDSAANSEVEPGTAGNSNFEADSDQEENDNGENKMKKRKIKTRQAPVDWQKILLAAIMVPGLPRR